MSASVVSLFPHRLNVSLSVSYSYPSLSLSFPFIYSEWEAADSLMMVLCVFSFILQSLQLVTWLVPIIFVISRVISIMREQGNVSSCFSNHISSFFIFLLILQVGALLHDLPLDD